MYNLLIMQQQLKRNDNLSLHTRTYFYHINSSFLYFHGSNLFFFYVMAEKKVSIHLTCKFRCRFCRYFPLPTDKKSRKKKANYDAISRYFSPWRIN